MALIIEDGSIVAGATSYATLAEMRVYALARGVTLSAVDATLETQAIKAMDYLQAQWDKYKGSIIEEGQPLFWPRKDVYLDGYLFDDDDIPQELKDAQCQLVIEIHNGINFYPTTNTTPFVTMKKIDVIEKRFSEKNGVSQIPIMPNVTRLLDRLFFKNAHYLNVVRV